MNNQTVIWKFEIPIDYKTHWVGIPGGDQAECIACRCTTPNIATLWVLLPVDAEASLVRFTVVDTGHPYPEDWNYIGTCFDREFVWHVVEVTTDEQLAG